LQTKIMSWERGAALLSLDLWRGDFAIGIGTEFQRMWDGPRRFSYAVIRRLASLAFFRIFVT
jgi:hypothetical protein